MATVDERVKKIIAEQLGVEEDEVVPEASFVEDLGADSLFDFRSLVGLIGTSKISPASRQRFRNKVTIRSCCPAGALPRKASRTFW